MESFIFINILIYSKFKYPVSIKIYSYSSDMTVKNIGRVFIGEVCDDQVGLRSRSAGGSLCDTAADASSSSRLVRAGDRGEHPAPSSPTIPTPPPPAGAAGRGSRGAGGGGSSSRRAQRRSHGRPCHGGGAPREALVRRGRVKLVAVLSRGGAPWSRRSPVAAWPWPRWAREGLDGLQRAGAW